MIYLPRTNEPGCSAGFVHGLVTGVAPDIDLSRPQEGRVVVVALVGEQLSLCAGLGGAEAVSCIRGTKVRNLLTAPPEDLVALVRQCDGFP